MSVSEWMRVMRERVRVVALLGIRILLVRSGKKEGRKEGKKGGRVSYARMFTVSVVSAMAIPAVTIEKMARQMEVGTM